MKLSEKGKSHEQREQLSREEQRERLSPKEREERHRELDEYLILEQNERRERA
jgi:hypothetical protein